ncbi:hypothetical protein ACLSSQ_04220 [Azospira sp. APE16]|uniref:capsular polysaccharide export protein, LipB/KpsS family n=1 Tax=Azospira sp. APE16 TaxID=3394231 RepID=UPI003A4D33A9
MSKRIFLVSANRSVSMLDSMQASVSKVSIAGALVYEPWDYPEWKQENTSVDTWGWMQIATERIAAIFDVKNYERALELILKDERVYFLFERHFGCGWDKSSFNNVGRIENVVWNSLAIIEFARPDVIFFSAPPHNPISWIFGRVAEIMDKETLMLSVSPFFHLKWLVRGLDLQQPVYVRRSQQSSVHNSVLSFFEKTRSTYRRGAPLYSRAALGNIWNWRRELIYLLKSRPSNYQIKLKRLCLKYSLFKRYEALATPFKIEGNYFVFFMHYQPEGTTLPYGLSFCQQWLAVSRLRISLPENVTLVVKEHPGIYTRELFRPAVRDSYLYENINRLPNTVLAPLGYDSFDLIDGAVGVATITGTAGFQSIIRGKPAIVFGCAPYRGFPNVFAVKSVSDICYAYESIRSNNVVCDNEKIEVAAVSVQEISYGEDDACETEWFSPRYYEKCLNSAIRDLNENDWMFQDFILPL